jgi:hypothetical protein
MFNYSDWPKREFCRSKQAEFYFLKVQTYWLNQTVSGNALISVERPQDCNK